MKKTQSISEIQISPKDGIKASGTITWAVLGVILIIGVLKYWPKIKHKVIHRKRKRK